MYLWVVLVGGEMKWGLVVVVPCVRVGPGKKGFSGRDVALPCRPVQRRVPVLALRVRIGTPSQQGGNGFSVPVR